MSTQPIPLTAEDVFTDTYKRFIKNWTFITALRQFVEIGMPFAEFALAEVHTDYIERIAVDPEYKKMIVKLDGGEASWDEETKRIFREGMTDNVVASTKSGIDAASLVFAQSTLDDCALSFLEACSIANPTDWEPIVSEKKVAFSDLQGRTPESIREELIKDKLKALEKDSLLKKVDLLFRLCSPPAGFAPINHYAYDRDELERIDEARHGIIHRDGLGNPIPTIEADLKFISGTANYLMALVNAKYGMQLSIFRIMNLANFPIG